MDTDYVYKRLGHLGEIHLVNSGEDKTLCDLFCNGPNFQEVTPVDLAPRPSPQLCPDCYEIHNASQKEEEPAKAE